MATNSSILAWEIPWTEEPGGLQSMGSQTVRQDLVTKQKQLGWGVAPKDLSAGLSEATAYPLICEVVGPRAPHPSGPVTPCTIITSLAFPAYYPCYMACYFSYTWWASYSFFLTHITKAFKCPGNPPTLTPHPGPPVGWAAPRQALHWGIWGPFWIQSSVNWQLWQWGHLKQTGMRHVHIADQVSGERKGRTLYWEHFSKPRMENLWPSGPSPVCVNEVLLESRHTHLLRYHRWLFSRYRGQVD